MKTLLNLFSTNKVIYDEDGCFEENIYLGINNKYLHYLQVRSNLLNIIKLFSDPQLSCE